MRLLWVLQPLHIPHCYQWFLLFTKNRIWLFSWLFLCFVINLSAQDEWVMYYSPMNPWTLWHNHPQMSYLWKTKANNIKLMSMLDHGFSLFSTFQIQTGKSWVCFDCFTQRCCSSFFNLVVCWIENNSKRINDLWLIYHWLQLRLKFVSVVLIFNASHSDFAPVSPILFPVRWLKIKHFFPFQLQANCCPWPHTFSSWSVAFAFNASLKDVAPASPISFAVCPPEN